MDLLDLLEKALATNTSYLIRIHENWHIKFSIMHKVSYVLAERYSQDPLETYFSFSCFFWGAFKNDVTGVGGGGYPKIVTKVT